MKTVCDKGATARRSTLRYVLRDRRGATAVEYGLIVALIVIAIIGSLQAVAGVTIDMWNDVDAKVTDATPDAQ